MDWPLAFLTAEEWELIKSNCHSIKLYKAKEIVLQAGKGLINAGVYLLRNNLFDDIIADKELSLEYDCFPTWLQERKRFEVTDDAAPFIDIGTPESLKRANELIENYQSLLCSYAESV